MCLAEGRFPAMPIEWKFHQPPIDKGETMVEIETAMRCFQENIALTSPKQDPRSWNLNNGLLHLAQALGQALDRQRLENAALKRQLDELSAQIRRLPR